MKQSLLYPLFYKFLQIIFTFDEIFITTTPGTINKSSHITLSVRNVELLRFLRTDSLLLYCEVPTFKRNHLLRPSFIRNAEIYLKFKKTSFCFEWELLAQSSSKSENHSTSFCPLSVRMSQRELDQRSHANWLDNINWLNLSPVLAAPIIPLGT